MSQDTQPEPRQPELHPLFQEIVDKFIPRPEPL